MTSYPADVGDGWSVIKLTTSSPINSGAQLKTFLENSGIESYEYAIGVVIRDFTTDPSTSERVTDFIYRGNFDKSVWVRWKNSAYNVMTAWTSSYGANLPSGSEFNVLVKS